MKKFNLEETIFLPFLAVGAFAIDIKWIALTCFIFLATLFPVMFWNDKLDKSEPKPTGWNMGGFIAGLLVFFIEGFFVWGFLRWGPFVM